MKNLLVIIYSLKNNSIKFAVSILFAVCLIITATSTVFSQTPTEAPLPKPTAPVTDSANVIDDGTEAALNKRLKDLQAGTNPPIEIAVVTIKTLEGADIFDYSLKLARGWGIGSKLDDNPSLLLLVAVDDRKSFTQVSRDAEGDLNDGLVGQYQRQYLVPAFRAGNYGKGINDLVEAYIHRFADQRGFDANNLQKRPKVKQTDEASAGGIFMCCIILIILFILFSIISSAFRGRGGRGGGGGGGSGGMFIPPIIWSGGGFGGSTGSNSGWGSSDSGGGDSWGGFGGGGDFGGGGAGSDW